MTTPDDYDPDTTGDMDENTLDGSEGLDADVLTSDGEDLTVDAPERWTDDDRGAALDERLAAERPDFGEGGAPAAPTAEGEGPYVTPEEEPRDPASFEADAGERTLGED